MKILVATKYTQGLRDNDFCCANEGEPVYLGSECDGGFVDDSCGCRRSLTGVKTRKSTTTFKVVEWEGFTEKDYQDLLHTSLLEGGWLEHMTEEEADDWVVNLVYEMGNITQGEIGEILERRGDYVRKRARMIDLKGLYTEASRCQKEYTAWVQRKKAL